MYKSRRPAIPTEHSQFHFYSCRPHDANELIEMVPAKVTDESFSITVLAPSSKAPNNAAVESGSADANESAPASSSMSASSCERRWCGRACGKCVVAARCVGRGARRALSAVGCVIALLLSPFIYAFTFLFWLLTLPVSCCCSSLSHLLTSLDVARLFRTSASTSSSASASAASTRRHSCADSGAEEDALERPADARFAMLQTERDIDL